MFGGGAKKEADRTHIRVLVVDDDVRIGATVEAGLCALGEYEVETAKDGVEGLRHVRTRKPDIIILDVEMPEMNGLQFLARLSEVHGIGRIPVIMMSGVDRADVKEDAFHEWAECYLVKPVSLQKLHERIQAVLGAHGRLNA